MDVPSEKSQDQGFAKNQRQGMEIIRGSHSVGLRTIPVLVPTSKCANSGFGPMRGDWMDPRSNSCMNREGSSTVVGIRGPVPNRQRIGGEQNTASLAAGRDRNLLSIAEQNVSSKVSREAKKAVLG